MRRPAVALRDSRFAGLYCLLDAMKSNLYALRHQTTGLFYNGTNFTERFAGFASLCPAESESEAVRRASLVWDGPIEAILVCPWDGANADAVWAVKIEWPTAS